MPQWRLLADADKADCKQRFINTVEDFRRDLLINTYSTVGWRANADFMIWRIGSDLDPFQEMTGVLNATPVCASGSESVVIVSATLTTVWPVLAPCEITTG